MGRIGQWRLSGRRKKTDLSLYLTAHFRLVYCSFASVLTILHGPKANLVCAVGLVNRDYLMCIMKEWLHAGTPSRVLYHTVPKPCLRCSTVASKREYFWYSGQNKVFLTSIISPKPKLAGAPLHKYFYGNARRRKRSKGINEANKGMLLLPLLIVRSHNALFAMINSNQTRSVGILGGTTALL